MMTQKERNTLNTNPIAKNENSPSVRAGIYRGEIDKLLMAIERKGWSRILMGNKR